jgi:hypothetical protein
MPRYFKWAPRILKNPVDAGAAKEAVVAMVIEYGVLEQAKAKAMHTFVKGEVPT